VRRLAGLIDTLARAGYEVNVDPGPVTGVDRAFTVDLFGNRIELVQPHANGAP
jgi:hypothetical protein